MNKIRRSVTWLLGLTILFTACDGNGFRDEVQGEAMPTRPNITHLNSLTWNPTALIDSGLTLLTFINPDCEHCHYQTGALLGEDAAKPAGLRLAFLSDVHPDSLKAFASQFTYDNTATVFLWDEGGIVAQQMGVSSYPTMFLYDTAGVHLQTIVGEAKPGYVYKFFHATH
ncbi:hypothetical protein QWY85_09885 [Neolewinella lacunae]|uniref:Thioredoxin domain-containing protein n=2 Tax=Neolewinella lacunae TaxID=1517758 RepID=A0A923PJY9_9BACT|nr:hypothetical protein [Neolewinella lacunae]MBC6993950.1 hypothetical protein [Neolewinella lacunae]MDN3634969.1 hypothetical protein [Neolewinella lacunae]